MKTWYAPFTMKMLMEFPKKKKDISVISKGGTYKYIHSAFDSETSGADGCISSSLWREILLGQTGKDVFETIERDGRRFSRFTEIDI